MLKAWPMLTNSIDLIDQLNAYAYALNIYILETVELLRTYYRYILSLSAPLIRKSNN